MIESRTLASERGNRAGAWRIKGELHSEGRQVSRRRERATKKIRPRGSTVEGNMSG